MMLSSRHPARHFARTLVFSSLALAMASAEAAPAYRVTSDQDSGFGTLREALQSGASNIVIDPKVAVIKIASTLEYTGTAALVIRGSGQTIDGDNNRNTLFEVTNGADVTLSNMTFTDGDYSSERWHGGGEGILITVPEDSKRDVVRVRLTNITVTGVGDHGIHVLDCMDVDCGNGNEGNGTGSPASVELDLEGVTIDRVGFGDFDADGLRVDERGAGSVTFRVRNSVFKEVGADGVEIDEGGDGDVILAANNVEFTGNGAYCDGLPDELPDEIIGTDDEGCYDEGEIDLDDGFDVDEAGAGSVLGGISNALVSDNFDEGLDFDEAGIGGINLKLVNIRAHDNYDEGIKLSAEDEGDVLAQLRRVVVTDNDDDGIQIEEEGSGTVAVTVAGSIIADNAKKGLKVEQTDEPAGTLKVRGSRVDEISTDNVDEI